MGELRRLPRGVTVIFFSWWNRMNHVGSTARMRLLEPELLEMIFGQSILISGSGTLPDGIDEGDEDTFLPFS